MADWGMKIAKSGQDISSNDPRNLLFHNNYNMLKYHQVLDGVLTLNPGDKEAHVDFVHGLGYVPAFLPYTQDLSNPGQLRFIGYSPASDFDPAYWAYADATKIRVGISLVGFAYNSYQQNAVDWYDNINNLAGSIVIGNKNGTSRAGALRFSGINIAHGTTITSALINYAEQFAGSNGTDLLSRTWGIAQDNIGAFDPATNNPMPLGQTNNFTDQSNASINSGNFFGINVTAIVQEILNRSGWTSGNSMAFKIYDNGTNSSGTGTYAEDDGNSGIDSALTISYGSAISLKVRVIIFKDKIQ